MIKFKFIVLILIFSLLSLGVWFLPIYWTEFTENKASLVISILSLIMAVVALGLAEKGERKFKAKINVWLNTKEKIDLSIKVGILIKLILKFLMS